MKKNRKHTSMAMVNLYCCGDDGAIAMLGL